jgi:hypothetical protein
MGKMSKADKMFKDLGYKKDEEPLDFFGEMIPYINFRDEICFRTISFNLKRKTINMTCVNENYEKVLQAINEKVKELGWNE